MTKQPEISPHPALKLRHTLRGHGSAVYRMALSPDGRILASPSQDRTVRLWNTESGRLVRTLRHGGSLVCVAWSPDGKRFASGGGYDDKQVTLWDAAAGKRIRVLGEHDEIVTGVAWSPDGGRLASCSHDKTIRLWDPAGRRAPRICRGHAASVQGIAWSPGGGQLCSASWDDPLRLWDPKTGESRRTLQGHNSLIHCVAWSPDGRTIASGSDDRTVRLWDAETGRQTMVLEGHTNWVLSVAFLDAGRLLAALGRDGRLLLWRIDDWAQVLRVDGIGESSVFTNLAAHPTLPIMAALGDYYHEIKIWEIDFERLRGAETTAQTTIYVNAKAVLLGDSGVGKSGLGIRIAEKEFRRTSSTHGAQFWHFPTDRLPGLPDGVQAELTLWDLAGQPEYRLTHQLFLDDADAALLLFDCADPHDPFRGVPYWAKVLKKHAPEHAQRFLVSSRYDVSPVTVDRREIDHFLGLHGLDGHYATSAATGEGVAELFGRLLAAIPWAELPRTSTPKLFQAIRAFLLEEKQRIRDPDNADAQPAKADARSTGGKEPSVPADSRPDVADSRPGDASPQSDGESPRCSPGSLLSMDALRRALQERFPEGKATQAEIDTVIGLLQTRGLVHRLKSPSGEDRILLRPECINQYGASIIQAARNHPQGIGAVTERDVLIGNIPFSGFARLPAAEERIVLEATVELLLGHDLGFREMGYLVFPSQIHVTRVPSPAIEGKPPPRAEVAYRFSGAIETIYASLVVRLSYTEHFRREDQWRYAVEFSRAGNRLGFSMAQVEEGAGEIEIWFEPNVTEFDRVTFIRFITDHLRTKGIDIQGQIRLYCPNCDEEVKNRAAIERRLADGKLAIPCQFCDTEIVIPAGVEEHCRRKPALGETQRELKDTVERRRNTEISAFRHDRQNYLDNLSPSSVVKNNQYSKKIEKISTSEMDAKLKGLRKMDTELFNKIVAAARTARAQQVYVSSPSKQLFSNDGILKAEYLIVAEYISRADSEELAQLIKSKEPVSYATPELVEKYWLQKLGDIAGKDGVIVKIDLSGIG